MVKKKVVIISIESSIARSFPFRWRLTHKITRATKGKKRHDSKKNTQHIPVNWVKSENQERKTNERHANRTYHLRLIRFSSTHIYEPNEWAVFIRLIYYNSKMHTILLALISQHSLRENGHNFRCDFVVVAVVCIDLRACVMSFVLNYYILHALFCALINYLPLILQSNENQWILSQFCELLLFLAPHWMYVAESVMTKHKLYCRWTFNKRFKPTQYIHQKWLSHSLKKMHQTLATTSKSELLFLPLAYPSVKCHEQNVHVLATIFAPILYVFISNEINKSWTNLCICYAEY